jgi:acyl carrier protein
VLDTMDIAVKLKNILSERFALDVTEWAEDTRLRDLGLDSMHLVDIMLDMETALGITLTDLSLPPNPSLGELGAVISKNLITLA